MDELNVRLIEKATDSLVGQVRRTPVEKSSELGQLLGVPVFLKLESLQTTGSFKLRGALFALRELGNRLGDRQVASCSAGNHGWALAYAARQLQKEVTVYLPGSVDTAKLEGIRGLGANVVVTDTAGYDEALAEALQDCQRHGHYYLSPYDDPLVMAANGGSLAAEVIEQVPEARNFLLPVGGGGLAAGFSMLVKDRVDGARLIGSQLEASPALALSLERGEAVLELPPIQTFAGGLEGGIGKRAFSYLRHLIDDVALAREEEVLGAVRWLLKHHRYLVEPSGAVGVAACLAGKVPSLEGPLVIVLSGRNVAFETLRKIMAEAPS